MAVIAMQFPISDKAAVSSPETSTEPWRRAARSTRPWAIARKFMQAKVRFRVGDARALHALP